MKTARAYFTLLTRDDDTSAWGIAFGDYSKTVVEQERRDSYSDSKRANWTIIETVDDQASIVRAVARMNGARV